MRHAAASPTPSAASGPRGFDYLDDRRGPMAALSDGERQVLVSEWPDTLIDLYALDLLTGAALAEVEAFLEDR